MSPKILIVEDEPSIAENIIYFTNLGLFNLEEARELERMSLRVAANF